MNTRNRIAVAAKWQGTGNRIAVAAKWDGPSNKLTRRDLENLMTAESKRLETEDQKRYAYLANDGS